MVLPGNLNLGLLQPWVQVYNHKHASNIDVGDKCIAMLQSPTLSSPQLPPPTFNYLHAQKLIQTQGERLYRFKGVLAIKGVSQKFVFQGLSSAIVRHDALTCLYVSSQGCT